MHDRRARLRSRFTLEGLEGRLVLSSISGIDDGSHHRRGGREAEVQILRHGADDAANHDANDDKGGQRGRRGRGADDGAGQNLTNDRGGSRNRRRGRGADDGANHDANDDKGGVRAMRRGADDPAGHDANDDRVGRRGRGRGADDPAGHR